MLQPIFSISPEPSTPSVAEADHQDLADATVEGEQLLDDEAIIATLYGALPPP